MEDPGLHYYDREIREAKERLNPVLGLDPDDDWPDINGQNLEIIYDHLLATVSFPFNAEFAMPNPEQGGEIILEIEIDGIQDPDLTDDILKHGLICQALNQGEPFKVPLAEIVIKQDDPNYHHIEDYCIWYWEVKSFES